MPRPRPALPLSLASIPFGVCVMLFVIALAGRPAVFPDTDDYLEHGRNTVMTAAYALHLKARPEPSDDPDDIAQDRQDEKESHLGIAARTPWYGVWLYVWQKLGTLWLLAAAQAAIAAALIWRLWRALAPRAPAWTCFAAQGVTALMSTLPFFAGFAMPDVFAGFTAIAAALLLADWDELGPAERAALALLLAYAVTLHASNALLAAAMAGIGALGAWLWRRRAVVRAASVLTLASAIAAGVAAASLSMAAVKWTTGDAAGRPPFLQARLLADGPGRRYLRHACAHGERYVLCAFRKLPLDDDEEILWSDDPSKGVYEVLDLDGRIDSVKGGIRTSFETIPDAPITRFVLAMKGGKKGLLENSRNLCAAGTGKATVEIDGQNGKTADQRPALNAGCGKKK